MKSHQPPCARGYVINLDPQSCVTWNQSGGIKWPPGCTFDMPAVQHYAPLKLLFLLWLGEKYSHGFNIFGSYLIHKHPVTVLGCQICFHSLRTYRKRENRKSLSQLLQLHINFLRLRFSYLGSALLCHTKETLLCCTPICSASAVSMMGCFGKCQPIKVFQGDQAEYWQLLSKHSELVWFSVAVW